MKAVVLAAGASTRLNPLTSALPKCLLPVGGKTVLDHQIDALIENGVHELVLVIGFQKQLILEHLKKVAPPINLTFIHNDAFATTGPIIGGLSPALGHFRESLLFFHCDVLFESRAIETLLASKHASALLYRKTTWDREAGKITVNSETDRVIELGKHIKKDRATGEYLQIAKFGKDFCARLSKVVATRAKEKRDGFTIDAFNDVVHDQSIEVIGIPFNGISLEIDTIEDYEQAQKLWKGA